MNNLVAKKDLATAVPLSTVPNGAPYPEQLVLDWTDYCNAKCFFCYREKYEQQIGGKGEFVPFEKLKKLEKVLSKVKVFGISSGIGEPLLHPELEEILQWLYRINPSILLRTTTNGTALTAAKAPLFAGHLEWLSVSLNAANGEAHMRDMFPHLAARGIDAEKRWYLHLRHMREFIAALPPDDRPRIRFQMVAHRYNVKDIVDFVRVVHSVGGSHAVITNIAAHAETVDWSLYWVKDLYNEAVDEACTLGTELGVRVDAARFYTSVKPVLDLDKVCRDPIDIAYISRASVGAPCCQWAEAGIPTDVYSDSDGFDRYWNHDILKRLRQKRNLESCRVCGMSRVFDETSFHFSPKLKQELIAGGKLSQINSSSDYPDSKLVRACVDNRLDLPSLRHTLSALNLPIEMSGEIATQGPAALSSLERACWEAFQKADVPVNGEPIPLARPFLGIGWGPPIYEPQNKVSARWISATQSASVFVRATTETSKPEARFTIHHAHPPGLVERLQLQVNGRPVETKLLSDRAGRRVISALLPRDLLSGHEGRIWVRIGIPDSTKQPNAHVSLMRFEVTELSLEDLLIEKDALIAQQQQRVAELKQHIHFLQNSRSWRLTAPLRRSGSWLRGCRPVVTLYRRLRQQLPQ
jgi:MoaA/NifB/PqqE/SkfB family radical SAM enzyme